ncbi:MAG: response regulator [Bacteroidetes bacterium]|nr:response regulator [Bacteroidota bacterium]
MNPIEKCYLPAMIKKLLLVDDDPDDVTTFFDAVKELDTEIILQHTPNGVQALEILSDEHISAPDIIFLDVNMPSLNGWQCLREIKNIARANTIPIIMYSTANLSQNAISPADVGAAAFYQKSNSFAELKNTLRHILVRYMGL